MRTYHRWLIAILVLAVAGLAGSASGRSMRDAVRETARKARAQQQSEEIRKLVDEQGAEFNRQLGSPAGSRSQKDETTRVVPLVLQRENRRIGIAQVCGPTEVVASVQAVVAVEVALQGKKLQGRMLIPADSPEVAGGFRRIRQVAVTATLDYQP